MKSILIKVVAFGLLYGIAAVATNFMFAKSSPEEPADEEVAQEGAFEEGAFEKARLQPETRPVPVALRPNSSIAVETIAQMSDSIRRTEKELSKRETKVVKDEERIKILFEDLSREREELRALTQGVDAKLETLSRMNDAIEGKIDELESKKAELAQLEKDTGKDDASIQQDIDDKVNGVKNWFANLEPAQAAEYLREFANNGKLEFAAALLQKMPDRQKSKILGAMADPLLVEQLVDAVSVKPSN